MPDSIQAINETKKRFCKFQAFSEMLGHIQAFGIGSCLTVIYTWYSLIQHIVPIFLNVIKMNRKCF